MLPSNRSAGGFSYRAKSATTIKAKSVTATVADHRIIECDRCSARRHSPQQALIEQPQFFNLVCGICLIELNVASTGDGLLRSFSERPQTFSSPLTRSNEQASRNSLGNPVKEPIRTHRTFSNCRNISKHSQFPRIILGESRSDE
jgi:hypothetical protein